MQSDENILKNSQLLFFPSPPSTKFKMFPKLVWIGFVSGVELSYCGVLVGV